MKGGAILITQGQPVETETLYRKQGCIVCHPTVRTSRKGILYTKEILAPSL